MKRDLLSLSLLLSASLASACSCFGPDTFCGVLNPPYEHPEWWLPDAVVMAVPLQQHFYGIDVVIVQVFQGTMNNDTVRVWGDNGALCRLYTDWQAGDTLILGLRQCDLMGNTVQNPEYPPNLERAEDYMISGCGVYLLDYQGGFVRGRIDESLQQTIALNVFTTMVGACALANGIPNELDVDPLEVRNTPGCVQMEWKGSRTSLDLLIADAQGRAVLRKRWDGSALTLDDLAPGAYVVEVRRGTDRFVRKVAVM